LIFLLLIMVFNRDFKSHVTLWLKIQLHIALRIKKISRYQRKIYRKIAYL